MYYPRSFLRFIVLGLLLIAAPLLYAIAELALSLERLSDESREAILQAVRVGRSSRQLVDQTTSLERIVRQYLILDDRAQLEDYRRVRQDFQSTYRQLSAVGLDAESQLGLDRMLDGEARLYRTLGPPAPSKEEGMLLIDGYEALSEIAQGTVAAVFRLTDREIERLRATAAEGRERWIWLTVAAVLIAMTLAGAFAVLIARPVRQIDQAIRRMGSAEFGEAVRVDGPQELFYLGQRLDWLRTRLAELEQQQNRFLRHVSHELKTPLTVVREGAELLRDRVGGTLSPAQEEIVRIVRENTLQLQKLIEDLLTYQQTRDAQPRPAQEVALADVIRRVLREQKLAAYARAVRVEAKLKPIPLSGDREKLRVIVDNLISNAIKYSPQGGIVTVRLAEQGREAVIDVVDEGPGIEAGERARIFDSFYQGSRAAEGRIKGSGLGLAIAREYVLAHRGNIEALGRADAKSGAHFRVRLPLGADAAEKSGERG